GAAVLKPRPLSAVVEYLAIVGQRRAAIGRYHRDRKIGFDIDDRQSRIAECHQAIRRQIYALTIGAPMLQMADHRHDALTRIPHRLAAQADDPRDPAHYRSPPGIAAPLSRRISVIRCWIAVAARRPAPRREEVKNRSCRARRASLLACHAVSIAA